MNTFNLTSPIYIVNPVANVDSRYGPWPTFNDALTGFSSTVREKGLTVAVSGIGGIIEYWYKNGVTDTDLVLKNTGGGTVQPQDIIPTVTNYLSTNNVLVSSLNIFDRFVVDNQLYYSTDAKVSQLDTLSGNYDEGQFLGKIKLSQNNTRLINVGENWTAKESNRAWIGIAMSSDGKYQSAVVYGGQIYISGDYGNTWTAKDSNRIWYDIAMSSDGKYQSAVVASGRIYISSDYGNTWTSKESNRIWYGIAMSSDGKYQSATDNGGRIYISRDYGNTWTAKESNRSWYGIAMSSDGKYQTATDNGGQIYISSDYGNTWTPKDSNREWYFIAMSSDGKYQSATVNGGQIYISSDYGNTWTSKESNRSWYGIAMSSDGKYQSATVTFGQIYISRDYGNTWTAKESNRNWRSIAMSSDGKYQSATVNGGQIYISVADELIDGSLNVTGTLIGKAQDNELSLTSSNTVKNSAIALRIQNIENSLSLVSPPPTYISPAATLSNFSPNILEVGETINQNLSIGWSQNDAGPVVNPFFVLSRNNSLAAQNSVPFNFSVNEVTTLGTVTFRNTVNFSDGPIKNNILGFPDERGRILSGSVFTERSYSARYRVFFGSVTSVPTNLRTLTGINWDTVNNFSFFAYNTNNVIVLPFNKQLVSVITSNFETVTNNFTLSSTTVPNGGGVPVSYNRYVQTTVLPFDLRLDVVLANV